MYLWWSTLQTSISTPHLCTPFNITWLTSNTYQYSLHLWTDWQLFITLVISSQWAEPIMLRNHQNTLQLWRKYSYIMMIVIVIDPTPNTFWMMTYGAWWVYEETSNRYMLHSPIVSSNCPDAFNSVIRFCLFCSFSLPFHSCFSLSWWSPSSSLFV